MSEAEEVLRSEALLFDDTDGVVTLTLNRTSRKNALNAELWLNLDEALQEVERRTDVKVLVLTGAGGDFCSGADLKESGMLRDGPVQGMRRANRVALALRSLACPTIAKVRGAAAGGGANLALACDFVFADESARFIQTFTQLGLIVDMGGTWLLPRLVGSRRATELALLGGSIGARDAEEMGLITKATTREDLERVVDATVNRVLQLPGSGVAATKRLLERSLLTSFADALAAEGDAQALAFSSEDFREAVKGFVRRRASPVTL